MPTNVIQLPDDDDDEDVPQRSAGRRSRAFSKRAHSSRASHLAYELVVQQLDDPVTVEKLTASPKPNPQPDSSNDE